MIVELSLAGEKPAWFILELQGTLHPVAAGASGDAPADGGGGGAAAAAAAAAAAGGGASPFAGQVLGDVAPRPGVKGGVTLHVGANKLHGVVEALPAPLVVVRRQTREEAAAARAAAQAAREAAAAAGAMVEGDASLDDDEEEEEEEEEEDDEDGGGGAGAGAGGAKVEAARYVIAAVVRSRIIFVDRPQPVTGAAALAKQTQAAEAAEAARAGGGR